MQSTPRTFCVVCGLTLLAFTGCQTYAPYGMGNYPGGVYHTPPSGYAPQPGVQLGAPSPIVTPGVPAYPAPTGASGNRMQNTAAGGAQASQPDAPLYNPNQDGSGISRENLAPDPIHLDPKNSEELRPTDSAKSEKDAGNPFDYKESSTNTINSSRKLASLETEPGGTVGNGDDKFFAPQQVEPEEIVTVSGENESRTPNPYDYDKKNYQWLRGKVDYDEQDKTWNIIYNLTPDQTDRFGGSATLIDHPDLSKLRNDDVVLLEGRIDPDSLDRTGKAKYRIDKLFGPLVPKQQVSTTAEN